MFDNVRKDLYFKKMNLLFYNGLRDHKIVPLPLDFVHAMDHTFVSGLPVSIHLKFLKPIIEPGKCLDRSLYMFFCFDDAVLVRGDCKDLEYKYGKEDSVHGWIEKDGFVYDPSLLMRIDKELYYKMYQPTNVTKSSKADYCSIEENKKLYDDIKSTTLEDYRPNGRKRLELALTMPLALGIAQNSGNKEFIRELSRFTNLIQYDENQVFAQLQEKYESMMESKR